VQILLKRHALLKSLITAAVVGLGLYGMSVASGNAQPNTCAASKAKLAAMEPLAKGEVAGVQVPKDSKALPDLAFTGPDGKSITLAFEPLGDMVRALPQGNARTGQTAGGIGRR
jgi:hypothetical protein